MKRIIALVAIFFFMGCSIVFADDFNDWLSTEKYKTGLERVKELELTAGTGFSFLDGEFKTIFTKTWAEYKGFKLNYGHDIKDMLVGTATYQVFTLKDTFKINIPILDMIGLDLGLYGGWKRIQLFSGTTGNNEWDTGFCFTILKKTF